MEVVVRPLGLEDLPPDALKDFQRYQVTRQAKYLEQGEYKLKDDYFIDEWSDAEKLRVVQDLRRCLEQGGFVAGAISAGALVGFANVENVPLGSRKQYLEMRYIHVSRECRAGVWASSCSSSAVRGPGNGGLRSCMSPLIPPWRPRNSMPPWAASRRRRLFPRSWPWSPGTFNWNIFSGGKQKGRLKLRCPLEYLRLLILTRLLVPTDCFGRPYLCSN